MMNLDSMRTDYVLVRRWWRDADGWTDEELAEADAGVKAAVDSRDADRIALWANWLAGLAENIRRFEASVRAAEARMRTAEERAAA